MKKGISLVLLCTTILLGFVTCKKDPDLPIVNTVGVNNQSINSCTAYGNITGLQISAKGFCWDTLDNPTVDKFRSDEGEGSESFKTEIKDLQPNKKYYCRAFAINSAGIAYGSVVKFQTLTSPTVITNTITYLTYSMAVCIGSVNNLAFPVIESGVCYDTKPNADISKSKVKTGTSNNINATLPNLIEKTVYYFRAYATFSFGTVYGAEKTFTTTAAPIPLVIFTNTGTVTDVDGTVYKTITIGSQTWMAENLRVQSYSDGVAIPYIPSGFTNWSLVTTGAIGKYYNSANNFNTYGALYNYYAVEETRGLAPAGWHIPSSSEWQTLLNVLNATNTSYSYTAVQHLYATGAWSNLSCNVNDYSNMSLLPAGQRDAQANDFDLGSSTAYWTSDNSGNYGTVVYFDYNCFSMVTSKLKNFGLSVRCVKD